MPKCFYCGKDLIWGGDENADEVFDDPSYRGRIYSNFTCPRCGAEYTSVSPDNEKFKKFIKMKVKVMKLDPKAVIPKKAHATDAGLDLTAIRKDVEKDALVYHTGLAFEIPEGHVGLLFPRSSVAKKDCFLTNCVGVIDSGYRGEVMFKFKPIHNPERHILEPLEVYEVGDRVGQIIIMPYPEIEFKEVEELSESDRGKGGYGSSGK